MAYAEGTEVAPEKSRAEIESTLKRYGASHFGYLTAPTEATVVFQLKRYKVRFTLPFPPLDQFKETGNGRKRTPIQADAAREKEERRRWRALALCVKAKLEAVESGITSFEAEFMAHIILPGVNMTVGQAMLPKIAKAIETGDTALALEWKP